MQNPRLASRYAKSIIDLVVANNGLDEVLADMRYVDALCSNSREFDNMLRSPVVKGDAKLRAINTILGDSVQPVTKSFITLLVSKGREANLWEIARAYVKLYNEMKNIEIVTVTTAVPITEATKETIGRKLTQSMPGKTIELKLQVDESLIGGFVIEVQDKLFDGSIKRELNDIKSNITDFSYVSKM
jgi:F-type H+-transporting ATPase subunit delta